MEITTLYAPAKINMYLHILGRRPDGYHDLVTRMQKLDLCDCIKMSLTDDPGVEFRCDDQQLPTGQDNLAVMAAQRILEALGKNRSCGVSINLEKKIPVAAGLGGGSSDAGTVLKGINNLLGNPFSRQELIDLGKEVGADVPFFTVDTGSVIAEGIGERLEMVPDIEGYWVLLVNPGISVSTQWVFENYALTKSNKNFKLKGFRGCDIKQFSPDQMHNDLESVTISHYPVVGSIKKTLLELGAVAAMMSGSGPTVYGLFNSDSYSEEKKHNLIERLTKVYGKRVYFARTCAGA